MTTVPFEKFHGFGNDYIVLERSMLPPSLSLSELAQKICHRNTGAGADGIAVLSKCDADYAEFACDIINPDGSIAGFSGNGTRCAVAFAYRTGLWDAPSLRLHTLTGVKNFKLVERDGVSGFTFEAEIGEPIFASQRIPLAVARRSEAVVNESIEVGGQIHGFSAVNVGNPVACIFVETFDFDWRSIGREMERHPLFPDRTNVVFVNVIDNDNIELRIWERGAGETAASGTCSAGAAVLSALMLKTGRDVRVHSPGGITRVVWAENGQMVLTGRAEFVYSGEWTL